MKISSSSFVKASSSYLDCPKIFIPEIAFIGRSNVGKSSLINSITNSKLAKVSQTPGKTRLINHFLINNNWHLVDLPGYGWAKSSKKEKENWQSMLCDYFVMRKQLAITALLIDSRLPPQPIDLEFADWITKKKIPNITVFTKIDKISKNQLQKNFSHFQHITQGNLKEVQDFFFSSSTENLGQKELLTFFEKIIKSTNTK